MTLRSYELERNATDAHEEVDVLGGPLSERLQEIRCPTLVLVGDEDVAAAYPRPPVRSS